MFQRCKLKVISDKIALVSSWVKHDVREAYSRLLRVCNSITMWPMSFRICIQLFLYLTTTISRDVYLYLLIFIYLFSVQDRLKVQKVRFEIARVKLSSLSPLWNKVSFPEIEDRNSICIFNRRHRSLYCIEIHSRLENRVHIFFYRIHGFKEQIWHIKSQ